METKSPRDLAGLVLGSIGLNGSPCLHALSCEELDDVCEAIQGYPLLDRVPLFGLVETARPFAGSASWALPEGIEADLAARSPGWLIRTADERDRLIRHLRGIDWTAVGHAVDAVVRTHLGLHGILLSYIVYGSLLWNPTGEVNDLDLVVVVEDSRAEVEVGSYYLDAPELRKVLPTDVGLCERVINASVVGRGALRRGSMSHDLANLACWTFKSGICVLGSPITEGISLFHALADIVIGLGFALKQLILPGSAEKVNKRRRMLQEAFVTCAQVAGKRCNPSFPVLPPEIGLLDLARVASGVGHAVTLAEEALKRNAIEKLKEWME